VDLCRRVAEPVLGVWPDESQEHPFFSFTIESNYVQFYNPNRVAICLERLQIDVERVTNLPCF